jgi:hypothetical protein
MAVSFRRIRIGGFDVNDGALGGRRLSAEFRV